MKTFVVPLFGILVSLYSVKAQKLTRESSPGAFHIPMRTDLYLELRPTLKDYTQCFFIFFLVADLILFDQSTQAYMILRPLQAGKILDSYANASSLPSIKYSRCAGIIGAFPTRDMGIHYEEFPIFLRLFWKQGNKVPFLQNPVSNRVRMPEKYFLFFTPSKNRESFTQATKWGEFKSDVETYYLHPLFIFNFEEAKEFQPGLYPLEIVGALFVCWYCGPSSSTNVFRYYYFDCSALNDCSSACAHTYHRIIDAGQSIGWMIENERLYSNALLSSATSGQADHVTFGRSNRVRLRVAIIQAVFPVLNASRRVYSQAHARLKESVVDINENQIYFITTEGLYTEENSMKAFGGDITGEVLWCLLIATKSFAAVLATSLWLLERKPVIQTLVMAVTQVMAAFLDQYPPPVRYLTGERNIYRICWMSILFAAFAINSRYKGLLNVGFSTANKYKTGKDRWVDYKNISLIGFIPEDECSEHSSLINRVSCDEHSCKHIPYLKQRSAGTCITLNIVEREESRLNALQSMKKLSMKSLQEELSAIEAFRRNLDAICPSDGENYLRNLYNVAKNNSERVSDGNGWNFNFDSMERISVYWNRLSMPVAFVITDTGFRWAWNMAKVFTKKFPHIRFAHTKSNYDASVSKERSYTQFQLTIPERVNYPAKVSWIPNRVVALAEGGIFMFLEKWDKITFPQYPMKWHEILEENHLRFHPISLTGTDVGNVFKIAAIGLQIAVLGFILEIMLYYVHPLVFNRWRRKEALVW